MPGALQQAREAPVDVITIGGNAIAAGTMTLGDLIQYIFFTGLMAAPIVQIASIGTQITEAFAGLDRIRELLDTTREDAADDILLNEIIWRSVRGADSPMPAPVRAAFYKTHTKDDGEK